MIGQPARSGRQSTSFLAAAREYGLRPLLLTTGTLAALGPALLVGLLSASGMVGAGALGQLGLGLVISATATFVLVLAVLCLGPMIFDRSYASALDEMGSLRPALFAFWWTASLAGAAIVGAVSLTVTAAAGAPVPVLVLISTLASFLSLASLFETLALGGTVMRHSLYRALVAADPEESASFLG